MSVTIAPGDPRAADTGALLAQSRALMDSLFAPEDNHYLPPEALAGPEKIFLEAREEGVLLGTGALARDPEDGRNAEIKAMFTAPAARGRGVAAALLTELEARARAEGVQVLRLETGDRLEAALRLYARAGFVPCPPFGDYVAGPSSVFMEKRLAAGMHGG